MSKFGPEFDQIMGSGGAPIVRFDESGDDPNAPQIPYACIGYIVLDEPFTVYEGIPGMLVKAPLSTVTIASAPDLNYEMKQLAFPFLVRFSPDDHSPLEFRVKFDYNSAISKHDRIGRSV